MRKRPTMAMERCRRTHPTLGKSPRGAMWGYFRFGAMNVIASDGEGWDIGGPPWEHVSVSLPERSPTWVEMCAVKRCFWGDDETVVQFHPAKRDYVNFHPHCLHLWRLSVGEFPKPPTITVGPIERER